MGVREGGCKRCGVVARGGRHEVALVFYACEVEVAIMPWSSLVRLLTDNSSAIPHRFGSRLEERSFIRIDIPFVTKFQSCFRGVLSRAISNNVSFKKAYGRRACVTSLPRIARSHT